jgi:PPP family 3-phenylpropionic acid transporter
MERRVTAKNLPASLDYPEVRGLRTVKILYFLIFGAIGALFPFLNLYYYSIGLSGTQIGVINMVAPLVGAFSNVFWGMLNDRFGQIRLLLALATLGVIFAVLVLSLADEFIWIVPAVGMLSLFGNPMNSLLDSTTLRLLKDHPENYGKYRVWGAYGFIISSSLTGFILEDLGNGWMFWLYAGAMVGFLVTSLTLPPQPATLVHASLLRDMRAMVRRPAWLVFAACVFLTWFAVFGGFVFIGVTMKAMGGGNQLVGLAATVAAVAELPVLPRSDKFLKRFGAGGLMAIGMFGYAVREALYAVMQAPTWPLVINAMQAVTYVPFWVGSVAYANELAPPELKSTSQGMMFMVMNLSNVAGALVSGWLFDLVGPRGLYAFLSAVCLAAFFLFLLGQRLVKRQAEAALP